ncbi:hypothetical protein SAMN02982918_0527 [Saccharomonospora viridis]|nr:hypothetical protein SAMN02982918_0527 [Saccharomonospora viridis]
MTTPFPPDEQHREIIYPINPEFFEDSPVDQGRDTEPPATMAAVPEHREPPKPLTTGSGINSRYRRRTTRQDSAENSSGVTTTRKETLLHHSYRSGKYAPAQGDIHINKTPEQNTNHRSRVRGEPLNSPRKDGRRCANIRGHNPRRAPPRPRPTRQHASTIVEPETATPRPFPLRAGSRRRHPEQERPIRSGRPVSTCGLIVAQAPHVHLVRFLREAFQLRSFTILSLICGFRTDSVRRLTTLPPILCRHDTGGSTR